MNANIIQCCNEEGAVEAEEQDEELRTVFRLIWWTEKVQDWPQQVPPSAGDGRQRSLTQDGGYLHFAPTLQLALLLSLLRVHTVLFGFAVGTLHRQRESHPRPFHSGGAQVQPFLHLLAVPPLLVHTFDLQQQTLHHFGQEVAGNGLTCVQQTFGCFRHRCMLTTEARQRRACS